MLWASCALPKSNPHQSQDGERGHAASERSRVICVLSVTSFLLNPALSVREASQCDKAAPPAPTEPLENGPKAWDPSELG